MKKLPTLLAALMLSVGIAGVAQADAFTDQVVADLQSKGYTRIEIKIFDNTVKAEAINGTQKLEITYDRATGSILKTENESVRPGENTSPGIKIDDRTGDSNDDDSSDDDSDDDEDHHGGSGHGSDDDEDHDEDHDGDNSGHGGGDDDGDDDEDEDEGEDDSEHGPNHD